MTLHGAHISRFLTAQNLSIRQFAISFDLHASQLNRVVNGKEELSKANLLKIVNLLLEKPSRANLTSDTTARALARSLIVHWLRDQVPEGWSDEIRITADEWSGISEIDISIDPRADAIAFFDQLSKEKDTVADWLIASKAVIVEPTTIDARLAQAATHRKASAGGGSFHDTIRHDAAPMSAAADHEP